MYQNVDNIVQNTFFSFHRYNFGHSLFKRSFCFLNILATETKGLSKMKTLYNDNNKNIIRPSKACALLLVYEDEEM